MEPSIKALLWPILLQVTDNHCHLLISDMRRWGVVDVGENEHAQNIFNGHYEPLSSHANPRLI
jgi:hypothetical protein